jgi:hypothetical protein
MKTLPFLLGICSLLVAFTSPGLAQQAPLTNQQLSKQFREGFLRGCVAGKTPGVKNQVGYCTCLASGYLGRYDGPTLNTISQLGGAAGENGVRLVNIMMVPEARSCTAKNR